MINVIMGSGNNNQPKIKYNETKEEGTGFLGLGGRETVRREKEMSVNEYFDETSTALGTKEKSLAVKTVEAGTIGLVAAGLNNNSNEATREYDQESINSTLWQVGDANSDGYMDKDEQYNLYYAAVTGNGDLYDPSIVKSSALTGVFASVGVSVIEQLIGEGKLTKEQTEALYSLLEADKEIDTDGDGLLNRDEFNDSPVNYILTRKSEEEE